MASASFSYFVGAKFFSDIMFQATGVAVDLFFGTDIRDIQYNILKSSLNVENVFKMFPFSKFVASDFLLFRV